jgi:ketosteroid isomerase-like protein
MKSTLLKVTLSIILFINATSALAQAPDAKTNSRLKQFRADYIKSLVDKKPELLQPYYADTVRIMPSFQKTVNGKTNAMIYHKAFDARFIVHSHVRKELEILDLGSQLMEIGTFTTQLTFRNSGKKHDLVGKYMNLWIKLSNNEMYLITEAWNYDQYYGDLHDQLRFDNVPSIHTALQPNVPVTSNVRFELAAMCRLLDATVTLHDGPTWSMFYSDDSILMPGYHPVKKGRKEIDQYINEHVKGLPIFEELDIRNDRIDELGMYVVEYASHIASWKNHSGSGVNFGKNIRIWRREPDHSLKVLRAIAMYD